MVCILWRYAWRALNLLCPPPAEQSSLVYGLLVVYVTLAGVIEWKRCRVVSNWSFYWSRHVRVYFTLRCVSVCPIAAACTPSHPRPSYIPQANPVCASRRGVGEVRSLPQSNEHAMMTDSRRVQFLDRGAINKIPPVPSAVYWTGVCIGMVVWMNKDPPLRRPIWWPCPNGAMGVKHLSLPPPSPKNTLSEFPKFFLFNSFACYV